MAVSGDRHIPGDELHLVDEPDRRDFCDPAWGLAKGELGNRLVDGGLIGLIA
jgi:hypothetical protein